MDRATSDAAVTLEQSREAFKCKGEQYNYTNENSEPRQPWNVGTLELWGVVHST